MNTAIYALSTYRSKDVSPLRRVTLDGGAPGAGTGGGRRGSLLVDGVLEDKRMFLTDAGLLADPLHSPPFAEAEYTHIKDFTQPGKKTMFGITQCLHRTPAVRCDASKDSRTHYNQ